MSRLTLLHINIIGAVVALVVGAALYFTLITGAQDERQKAETARKAVEDRAAKLPQAKAALAKAEQAEKDAIAHYKVFDVAYMPSMGYAATRMETMIRDFWPNRGRSFPERYRRTIMNYMNQERRLRGIVWENPGVLVFGPYGPDPNTISPDGSAGLEGPLHFTYQMRVRGKNLQTLLAHVRNWPSIRQAGVPVVEGFTVSGNSPNLYADYSVTFTIIVRDPVPPVDPRVGGSQSGGGGGGGFGPGGMGGGRGNFGPPGMSMGPAAAGLMSGGGGAGPGSASMGLSPRGGGPAGSGGGGGRMNAMSAE